MPTPSTARMHDFEVVSNKEIAGRLSLSEQTVKAHLSHMTTKCGRANRAALVAYGFETGLLRRR